MIIEGRIQKVEHTTIKGTPVTRFMVPTWNRETKTTAWKKITVWEPTNPNKFRNGRTAKMTLRLVRGRKGGMFYNLTEISFNLTDKDRQMSLPF